MRRALWILLAVVVLVPLAGLAAAHLLLNGAALRARIAALVERQTGRTLTIAGPVQLGWSLTPTLSLDEVSLANPPGFSRPALATAKRVEVSVALLPLLSHRLEVRRVAIAAPDVRLERNAKGEPNWVFARAAGQERVPDSSPAPASGTPYALSLGRVEVRDAQLAYGGAALAIQQLDYDGRDGQVRGRLATRGVDFALSGSAGPIVGAAWPIALRLQGGGLDASLSGTSQSAGLALSAGDLGAVSPLAGAALPPLHDVRLAATLSGAGVSGIELRVGASELGGLSLQQAELTAPSPSGPADLRGAAAYRSRLIALSGHAASLAGLMAGPVPVTLRAETDDAVLEANGTAGPGAATLALDLRAGDPSRADPSLPPLQNLQLRAELSASPDRIALAKLKATSAQGDLDGSLTIVRAPRPRLDGTLHSGRLDLDGLIPAGARPATPPGTPAPAAATAPPAPPGAGRVIPDRPIPFGTLQSADADLQLGIDQAKLAGRTLDGVTGHLVLSDGKLTAAPLGMALGAHRLGAELHADAAGQSVALKVDGDALPAGAVFALFGGPAEAGGTLGVHVDLRATGGTVRAAAAALDGRAGLAVQDAQIDNAWLRSAFVAFKLPIDAGGGTTLRCAALQAQAAHGRVTLSELALDSSKLALSGSGTVDLGPETLDLHLSPRLQIGTALSIPVRVEGTLAAPKVALDPGAIAPGRVGILLGGSAPAPGCAAATAEPARPPKPADLLRSLLR